MKRKWGRKVGVDSRDSKYLLPRTTSQRTRRHWRGDWWIGDQGMTPCCVGYAWSGWLSNSPYSQWINPEGIYTLAQYFDEWVGQDYAGTSVRAGAKIIKTLGYIGSYSWAFELGPVIDTILEVGPVVIGTNWYANMNSPDDNNIVRANGKLLGGHAYVLTGIDTKKELLRLKNSWSREWGIRGQAYISFEDFERLLGEDGEVCLGKEVRVER